MLRKPKKTEEEDEFDEETEEDDTLEDEEEPKKLESKRLFKQKEEPSHFHVVGEVTTELLDLGNGTFKPIKRVWANSKESAVSDDPLLVLLCQKLFPQISKE